MDTTKNWKNLIPDILLVFKTSITNYSMNPTHILIVEGKTDNDFYLNLFGNSSFVLNNGKKIILNTKKNQVLYDIFSSTNKGWDDLFKKSNTYKYKDDLRNDDDLHNRINSDDIDKSNYGAYSFVIECIKYYESHLNDFKKYNFYGLIDKDFGHMEDTKGLKNISTTKCHDRETSLIRCYFPDYISKISINDEIIEQISLALDFCFKQGILEQCSIKYSDKNPDDLKTIKLLKSLTHHFFHNNVNNIVFSNTKQKFDFSKYFYESKDYFTIYESGFIDYFKESLSKQYTFEKELPNLVRKWLMNKETDKIDEKRLDRIFKICNGHILINQLALITNGKIGFSSEDEFITKLNNIIYNGKNYEKIFMALPLKPYKEYRLVNGFYISL